MFQLTGSMFRLTGNHTSNQHILVICYNILDISAQARTSRGPFSITDHLAGGCDRYQPKGLTLSFRSVPGSPSNSSMSSRYGPFKSMPRNDALDSVFRQKVAISRQPEHSRTLARVSHSRTTLAHFESVREPSLQAVLHVDAL